MGAFVVIQNHCKRWFFYFVKIMLMYCESITKVLYICISNNTKKYRL